MTPSLETQFLQKFYKYLRTQNTSDRYCDYPNWRYKSNLLQ